MKNKTMLIFFAVVLVIAMAIVIKGTMDKKEQKDRDILHAKNVASGESTKEAATEEKYEFYQTDPDTGLAVIYTFEASLGNDGKGSGSITLDNREDITKISCAVKKENDSIVFVFAKYDENDTKYGNFSLGDILVKLHKNEKGIAAEWVSLKSLYPGEEVVRNY